NEFEQLLRNVCPAGRDLAPPVLSPTRPPSNPPLIAYGLTDHRAGFRKAVGGTRPFARACCRSVPADAPAAERNTRPSPQREGAAPPGRSRSAYPDRTRGEAGGRARSRDDPAGAPRGIGENAPRPRPRSRRLRERAAHRPSLQPPRSRARPRWRG